MLDLIGLIDETDFNGICSHLISSKSPGYAVEVVDAATIKPEHVAKPPEAETRLDFFGHWILSDSTISISMDLNISQHISKDLKIYGFGRFVFPMLLETFGA